MNPVINASVDHEKGIPKMGIKDRSSKRRKRIVANRTSSFQDAEKWDFGNSPSSFDTNKKICFSVNFIRLLALKS